MTSETAFIPQALRVISEAVVDIIGKTNLHVRQTPLPKRLASRASARLRALEQMLRRVIVLMALAILPGLKAPLARRPHISIIGLPGPEPIKRAKDRFHIIRRPQRPGLAPISGDGPPPDFATFPARAMPRSPSMARLIARIQTLQRLLANPQHMARRLAGHFARLKAQQKDRPRLPPPLSLRRAPAELALVAGALPIELKRALAKWPDTS